MMSLYAPNATMTVGPGATASGVDEIRRFWLEESAPFAAENTLDLGSPRVQARDHGQRRPGHAALRVPLRRRRDRRGRVGHDRRLRRGPDRREVADHEHGRRDDRPGSLRPWPRSRSRGSPRGAATDRRSARPRRRAPAGQGSDEAADRVRRHVAAACRGRSAGATRARAVERSRRERRAAPGAGRPVQPDSRPRPRHLRDVLAVNVGDRFNVVWPDAGPRQVRGTYSLAVDLFARRRGRSDRGADGPGSAPVHAASGGPRDPAAGSRTRPTSSRGCSRRRSSRSTATANDLERRQGADRRMLPLRARAEQLRERPLPGRRVAGERDARRRSRS